MQCIGMFYWNPDSITEQVRQNGSGGDNSYREVSLGSNCFRSAGYREQHLSATAPLIQISDLPTAESTGC